MGWRVRAAMLGVFLATNGVASHAALAVQQPEIKFCGGYELYQGAPVTADEKQRIERMYFRGENGEVFPEMSRSTRAAVVDGKTVAVRACHYFHAEDLAIDERPQSSLCLVAGVASACPEMDSCCNPPKSYSDGQNALMKELLGENSWNSVRVDDRMLPIAPWEDFRSMLITRAPLEKRLGQ